MVDLKRITKGKIDRPPRALIYGFEGVGKTSWAIGAPNSFVIDANKGSSNFVTDRVYVDTWVEVNEWTDAVESGEVKCDTVIYDTIPDLEQMSYVHLFQGTTITKYDGGFNKGDDVAMLEWRRFLSKLERLWISGTTIIFVSHAKVKTFSDPTGTSYERFELLGRPSLTGLIKGWCDYVLFAREEVAVATEKNKPGKARTTGERWIYTRRTPAYDAKARGTFLFPEKIPLSWGEFAKAIKNDKDASTRIEELKVEIDSMLAELSDKAYEKTVRDYLKAYPSGVVDAHNRVRIRMGEVRSAAETNVEKETGT